MQSLDTKRGDKSARLEVLQRGRAVAVRREDVGVGRLEPVDEVDLLVGRFDDGRVDLVAVVGAVGRAEPEDGPEGAAVLAGAEAGDVDVAGEAALGPRLGEGGFVDFVFVDGAEEDGEVVVPV